MKITIFGASGKTGREVVKLALVHGHSVRAFVHNSNPFEVQPGLEIIKGDVSDAEIVAVAMEGSEAVISCLSTFKAKDKAIVSNGIRNIIMGMEAQNIKRVVSLTGSGAVWEKDRLRLVDHFNHRVLGLVADKILKDGESHLHLLMNSGLDWTVIRSPVMTKGTSAAYRLSLKLPMPWTTIPRPAVVQCMLDQLSDKTFYQNAPILYKA